MWGVVLLSCVVCVVQSSIAAVWLYGCSLSVSLWNM